MLLAVSLRPAFGLVIAAYLILMTAYTFQLKHLVIIDVFAISAGFVLRAAGGAVVLDVPISPWLYVCTVLLSLFVAFGKRRHELLLLESTASGHRRNLEDYSAEMLNQFIMIAAAATVMAYSLYTFVAPNLPENHAMMLTIPFVLYAIFRYLFLILRREGGGSPEQVLFSDRLLLGSIVAWGFACVIILYGPWS
jgi:4-hydroxybenzoate polyprenyltransferase